MASKIQLPPLKSFEEIWALVQETSATQKETAESAKKHDKEIEEIRAIYREISAGVKKHDKEIEEIRAILRENAESAKKHDKEMEEIRATHREINAMLKETDRILKENAEASKKHDKEMEKIRAMLSENSESRKKADPELKEIWRLIKENGKQMGFIQNRLDELIEHIVMPGINKKFKLYKYNFGTPQRGLEFYDKNLDLVAEVDIVMADNDGNLMLGEVKTTLSKKHIDDHVKRIEAIKKATYMPSVDGRVLMGFMAGAIVRDDVKEYAHQNGFFVAVQSGDTVKLDVPDGFVPKTW